jgi:LL-diaminopimelate aminotransferase
MFENAKRLKVLPPYLFAKLDKMKSEAIKKGLDVISFGIGDPDIPTPRHIVKSLQKASENPAHHRYPSYEGMFSFRQAVAKWYAKRFGVKLNPEDEVISLIGAKEGIGHIPLAFINPGDVVLVPEPAYPVYRIGTIFAGGTPYMMPLIEKNGFLPDYSKINSRILKHTKMIFLNYPNNPTAAAAPLSFLKDSVKFAKKHNLILCYDNTYSEMAFDGYRAPSILQVSGAKDVCIEYNSLSKTYNMTGWRIGWACGNKEILAGLGKIKTNLDSGVFQAVQEAAITALSSSQECVKTNIKILKERRDVLVGGLKELGWGVNLPKATFYIWAHIPYSQTISSADMCAKLLSDCGVLATPGNGFGPSGEGYLRFAVTVDVKRIKEALLRIKNQKLS